MQDGYKIGLVERRREITSEVVHHGGSPADPENGVSEVQPSTEVRVHLQPLEGVVEDPEEIADWLGGGWAGWSDEHKTQFVQDVTTAHQRVTAAEWPTWESQANAELLEGGASTSWASLLEGIEMSKAEYRLERRAIAGQAAPVDGEGNPIKPEVRRTFLKVKESLASSPTGKVSEVLGTVEFVIAEGEDVSSNTEVLPAPSFNAGEVTLRLLPVEIIDTKNKTINDADDVIIAPKATVETQSDASIAWIEPHGADDGSNAPDMPQLALCFMGAESMSLRIKWKLQVIYSRPRGTNFNESQITAQDEVFIPKKTQNEQPWKEEALDGTIEFFNHADWIAELQEKGMFGGEAQLKYQLLRADGTMLGSTATLLFSIGGRNPDDAIARQYIDPHATSADAELTILSYAVAKHESKDYNGEGSRYNQFWEGYGRRFRVDHKNGDPLWCKAPSESSAGGFGMYQITGNLTSQHAIIPREQLWIWRKNIQAYVIIVKTGGNAAKGSVMDRFIAAVARTYPNDNEAQTPPSAYTYDEDTYGAWEMGTITLYNGAGGCPRSRLKNAVGKWTTLINPWQFDLSGVAGSKWQYNANSNNYLHEVILER